MFIAFDPPQICAVLATHFIVHPVQFDVAVDAIWLPQ